MSEPDACPYMCHCHGNMDVDIFAVHTVGDATYSFIAASPKKTKKKRSERDTRNP